MCQLPGDCHSWGGCVTPPLLLGEWRILGLLLLACVQKPVPRTHSRSDTDVPEERPCLTLVCGHPELVPLRPRPGSAAPPTCAHLLPLPPTSPPLSPIPRPLPLPPQAQSSLLLPGDAPRLTPPAQLGGPSLHRSAIPPPGATAPSCLTRGPPGALLTPILLCVPSHSHVV